MQEEKMKAGLMLGVNPNTKRQEQDFYATHPNALIVFLNKLKEDNVELNKNIWECASGKRHLANVLLDYGYEVKITDLIKRIDGVIEKDYLLETESFNGDILTNPPFNLAEKFIEKSMNLLNEGNKLLLFLKIQFLEEQKRKELFKKFPPKYVYCYSARQKCARDGEFEKYTATTQFYAWYIWEKGFKGETIIRWI